MRMSLREASAWLAVVAMTIATTVQGCRHASDREAFRGENDGLIEENTRLERELDEARGEADGLELEVRRLEARIEAAGRGDGKK